MRAAVDAAPESIRHVAVDIGAVTRVQERAHVFKDQTIGIKVNDIVAVVVNAQHLGDAFRKRPDIIKNVYRVGTNVFHRQRKGYVARTLVNLSENQVYLGHKLNCPNLSAR